MPQHSDAIPNTIGCHERRLQRWLFHYTKHHLPLRWLSPHPAISFFYTRARDKLAQRMVDSDIWHIAIEESTPMLRPQNMDHNIQVIYCGLFNSSPTAIVFSYCCSPSNVTPFRCHSLSLVSKFIWSLRWTMNVLQPKRKRLKYLVKFHLIQKSCKDIIYNTFEPSSHCQRTE